MHPHGFLLVATFVASTLAGAVWADSVSGTRSDRLAESEHRVELVVDRGHATAVVRRTVYNGGSRHDQAMFWIDVPASGVATGLRTLGTFEGRPRWFAISSYRIDSKLRGSRGWSGFEGVAARRRSSDFSP
jgi:hypothetical protein